MALSATHIDTAALSFSDLNPWHDHYQEELLKIVGYGFKGTVKDILGNTTKGAGKDLAEIINLNKGIMSHVGKKINEAGRENSESLQRGLESVMRNMLSILLEFVGKIDDLKIEVFETRAKSQEHNSDPKQEQPVEEQHVEGPDETANDESTNMTGASGPQGMSPRKQIPAGGLFMMTLPNGPWGEPNAHAMCTPTPMGNYCAVHGNAPVWPGAQAPCFHAARGPWPSVLSNAQTAGCAQLPVCYVLKPA